MVVSRQWYFNYDDVLPGNIAGAAGDRFHTGATTETMMVAPQSSQYVWCTITDNCGAQVTSTHAMLAVPDPATCP